MPALSTSNGELLMAKVLEWKSFEDDIDREDDEGTAAVFWLATFEFTAASKTPVDLLFVWSDDNPEADVSNIREAEDNRRNFWYCVCRCSVGSRPSDKGGGRSSRPWDYGGARTQQKVSSALRTLGWSKSKGMGVLPWIHHWLVSVLRVVDCTRKLLSVKVETLKNEQKVFVRDGINKELRLIFNSLSLQLLLDPINKRRLITTILAFGNSDVVVNSLV